MKMAHPDWEKQIRWTDENIPLLILENPKNHYETIDGLRRQMETGEGKFILAEGDKEYELGKFAEMIGSPWDMDFSGKKLTAAFWARIKNEAQGAPSDEKRQRAVSALLQYADEISLQSVLPITYDLNPEPATLLKSIRLRLDIQDMTLPEQMLSYMDICTELLHTKCFILSRMRSFLSETELNEFYRNVIEKKHRILLIEDHESGILPKEERFIIDRDLCQIF